MRSELRLLERDAMNNARSLARTAIREAFMMPTAGDAGDVAVGFVPWTMENLCNEALDYLDDNSAPELPIHEAKQMVWDYFRLCGVAC